MLKPFCSSSSAVRCRLQTAVVQGSPLVAPRSKSSTSELRTAIYYARACTPSLYTSFGGARLAGVSHLIHTMQQRLNVKGAYKLPPRMSFLGVGAPEAILVAVVALVVFGPKGLADAAKSLGQALRAFQPTIKEVVEVSQDLKSTLETELGLDELRQASRPIPRASQSVLNPPTTSKGAEEVDLDIEAKRAMSAQMAWSSQDSRPSNSPSSENSPKTSQNLSALTMEELEAELARRKMLASRPPPQEGGSSGGSQ